MPKSLSYQRFKQKIILLYRKIIESTAFLPSVLVIIFLIACWLVFNFDISINPSYHFLNILLVKNVEISRSVVTTVAGGTISLMVFSFSMVMVVLNEAASNFTPRVLPNLVSDQKYQSILGFYAGTILFTFIMLLGLGSKHLPAYNFQTIAIISVLMMVINIGLFVVFIHHISKSIQMRSIILKLRSKTSEQLNADAQNIEVPETDEWLKIYSTNAGYFHGLLINFVSDYFKKEDHHIVVHPYINQYVRKGDLLYSIKEKINPLELESLTESFIIRRQQHDSQNTVNRIIQLQEIAVKAMSPGINDPGTLLEIITILEELILLYSKEEKWTKKINSTNKLNIYLKNMPLGKLLPRIYEPIIHYSSGDTIVLKSIKESLVYLKRRINNPNLDKNINLLIQLCDNKS